VLSRFAGASGILVECTEQWSDIVEGGAGWCQDRVAELEHIRKIAKKLTRLSPLIVCISIPS
jgi:hypothetical protein